MSIEELIFYIFAFLAIASAVFVVSSQHLVRSVFMFFITLFCVAGLYIFALADFVALTQIVIYVGGVLVLLLFVFMLSSKDALESLDKLKNEGLSTNRLPGLFVCLSMLIILIYGVFQIDFESLEWIKTAHLTGNVKTVYEDNITNLGINLMTKFLLPFELISILLMMTLVGAAHLARKEEEQ